MNAITSSETARLAKLYDYGVLDTAPEREFDEITAAAARLFKMPISTVSLIDRDRQWFKARYGIGATETPRDQAFCSHAIEGDDVYVVPDATKDPLFAENPLVLGDPNIRFYAGAPLITPDKFRLGTLCIIDRTPHDPLTEEQQTLLVMLARLVVRELENRRIARRAEHQAQMAARLTEAAIAVAQADNTDALARVLADHARRLCAADAVRVNLPGAAPAVAARNGATVEFPWADGDRFLTGQPVGRMAETPPPGYPAGAWLGVRLGDGALLQIARRVTAAFTEFERALLTDLARLCVPLLARTKSG